MSRMCSNSHYYYVHYYYDVPCGVLRAYIFVFEAQLKTCEHLLRPNNISLPGMRHCDVLVPCL